MPKFEQQDSIETTESKGDSKLWSVFTLVLPLLGSLTLLVFEAVELWNRPHMRFAWVAVAVAGLLAALRLRGAPTVRPVRRWAAVTLFGISAAVFLAAVFLFSPPMAHLAAIGFFVAWAWGRFGGTHWAQAGAIGGLLLLTVPLPFGWDIDLIDWLRQFSVWATHRTLDSLSVPNIRYGDLIELRGLQVNAMSLCGGVKSLYLYAAIAAVFLILQRQSWMTAVKLLLSLPFLLVTFNYLKLLSICIAFEYWGRDATNGLDFGVLDIGLAVLFILSIWVFAKMIGRLMEPVPMTDGEYALVFAGMNNLISWPQPDPLSMIPPEDEDDRRHWEKMREEELKKQNDFVPLVWQELGWLKWSVIGVGVFIALAGLLPGYILVRDASQLSLLNESATESEIEAISKLEVAPMLGEAQLAGVTTQLRQPTSDMGNVSVLWLFQLGRQELVSTISFPFQGFHDAAELREAIGWTVEEVSDREQDGILIREVSMQNELGGSSTLLFGAIDERGQSISEQRSSIAEGRTILTLLSGERYRPSPRCYEVLVRYDASEESASDFTSAAEEVFIHTVQKLREALTKG